MDTVGLFYIIFFLFDRLHMCATKTQIFHVPLKYFIELTSKWEVFVKKFKQASLHFDFSFVVDPE